MAKSVEKKAAGLTETDSDATESKAKTFKNNTNESFRFDHDGDDKIVSAGQTITLESNSYLDSLVALGRFSVIDTRETEEVESADDADSDIQ